MRPTWEQLPHPGHLVIAPECEFFLNTYLGNGYLVSTVGEWRMDEGVQRAIAPIHDPVWFDEHQHLQGDAWKYAYQRRFGFKEIGADRLYETMVFEAQAVTPDMMKNGSTVCCPWIQHSGNNLDMDGYNDAAAARLGHWALCERWADGKPEDA